MLRKGNDECMKPLSALYILGTNILLKILALSAFMTLQPNVCDELEMEILEGTVL